MRMAITPHQVTAAQIEAVCRKPIDALQLRQKKQTARAFYELAVEARALTKKRGILLIINDRLDIALSVGADGVHLPQNSLPPEAVRYPNFLVGVSAHTLEEAKAAEKGGASYITFSPAPLAPVGKFSIPVLALGNITEETCTLYREGYAAIRMFFGG